MEDQLRQRLNQHPTPIDIDALWGKVESRLPKKKRRIPPFWFWMFAGLVLALSFQFLPGGEGTTPLVENVETAPAPAAPSPSPPAPIAKEVQAQIPESPPLTADGTATKAPKLKPILASQNTQISNSPSPQTVATVSSPSAPAPEREAPMVYAKIETPGPEINTTLPTLTIDVISKPGDIALPQPLPTLNLEAPIAQPFVIITPDPAIEPSELAEKSATPETESEQAKAKNRTTKKAQVQQPQALPREDLRARKQAAKMATAEAQRTDKERLAAKKSAARKAEEFARKEHIAKTKAEKITTADAKRAEEQRRTAEETATREAEEFARQERQAKKEAARFAARDKAKLKVDLKGSRNLSQAVEKENARLASVKAKQAKQEQRALTKSDLRRAQIQAREQREADRQRAQRAKVEAAQARTLAKAKNLTEQITLKEQEESLAEQLREKGEATRRIAQREAEQREAREWATKRSSEIAEREAAEKRRAIARMEAKRARLLTNQRQASNEHDQLWANAIVRKKAQEARLVARVDRKAARALARAGRKKKVKKPRKIREKKPAYWTVEPGIALSLPMGSAGGDGPGSERALEGISLQGLVGYHHASGLSLRTGLAMSRINSKIETEITRPGSQSQDAVVAIIEAPNGSRTEQRGTVQVATTETITTKYYNSVNSMDIPVLLGYRLAGTKWGLMVEAGPTFNLSSGGEAHRYNGSGFAAVGDGYFRDKLEGLGFLVNFGGAYGLTETTSLTANLRFQSFGSGGFVNPDAAEASPTNYSLIGIQIGYRIRF